MIPDDLEALVLADAVGALDPHERAELQARLDALTPQQASEVASLYDAATAVALTVPPLEPPAHVRERVLAAAARPVATPCGRPRRAGSTPACLAFVPGSWPWTRRVRSSRWSFAPRPALSTRRTSTTDRKSAS